MMLQSPDSMGINDGAESGSNDVNYAAEIDLVLQMMPKNLNQVV
jgi:hypothetical protein